MIDLKSKEWIRVNKEERGEKRVLSFEWLLWANGKGASQGAYPMGAQ